MRTHGPATCGVLVHDRECAACASFVEQLASDDRLAEEVRIITSRAGAPDASASLDARFVVLLDAEHRVAQALGLDAPAWFVADRWGALTATGSAGDEHHWPPATELVEWISYTTVQCPECQGEAY